MPLIIETEDGQTFGPDQPYGYQGQYQGQRQPGLETANMRSVPQRTTQRGQVEDVFDQRRLGLGEGPYTSGVQDVFDQRRLGLGGGPHTYGKDPFDPRRLGLGGGPLTYGKDPFDPRRLGMGSGSYLSSRYGGGLDDAAGMNDDARGMIEGAGFDVAGKTTDDRVSEKLWGKAVNSFPPGTPDMQIQQEWERLKKIYFDSTYGTPTLPGRGDIVGLS